MYFIILVVFGYFPFLLGRLGGAVLFHFFKVVYDRPFHQVFLFSGL